MFLRAKWLLILALPLAVPGCDRGTEHGKFLIDMPAGWQSPRHSTPGIAQLALRPLNGKAEFDENVNVIEEPNPQHATLHDWQVAAKLEAVKRLAKYEVVSEGDQTVDGEQLHWIESRWEMIKAGRKYPLHVLTGIVLHDGQVYTITCSATEQTYPTYVPAFAKVIRSVRFH